MMIKFKDILKEAFEGMNSVVSIGGPIQMKEAAPKMKSIPEIKIAAEVMMKLANLKKGGSGNRYGREFEKAKTKALRAMEDMISYIKIGV